jgi:uncharacterized membrane protein
MQRSVLPDLGRPPAGLGPRREAWIRYSLLISLFFTVLVLVLILLGEAPGIPPVLAGTLLLVLLVVVLLGSYSMYRLGVGNSVLFQTFAARRGARFGNPDADTRRRADRQETEARRLLRRKKITRVQYERILAQRRFAHGELTSAEYHEVLAFLDRVSGAPPDQS